MLISEGLFAAANIFSNLKLVYIFSINPHLGPLQVTLGRMVFDMMKWALLFLLVHFAFSCGEFSWDLGTSRRYYMIVTCISSLQSVALGCLGKGFIKSFLGNSTGWWATIQLPCSQGNL